MIKQIFLEECAGIKLPVHIDFGVYPHFLIVGSSGSGKTYFSKALLAKISKYEKQTELVLIDYKGDQDFSMFSKAYRFDKSFEGLRYFFGRFKKRQEGIDKERIPLYLFFDEFGAFVSNQDRKQQEEIKRMIATLLMLGRSFRCHVIVSLQRADSSYFSGGARDNFSLRLGLGRMSPESKKMLFGELSSEIFLGSRGVGYFQADGFDIKKVVVAKISNELALNQAIEKIMISDQD